MNGKMKIYLFCLVFLFGCAAVSVKSSSKPSSLPQRYELRKKDIGRGFTRITLVDEKTGVKKLNRVFYHINRIEWSQDHKALAIIEGQLPPFYYSFRLTLWRENRPVAVYYDVKPFNASEAILEIKWSPDKTKLLIIAPHSFGDAEAGWGKLWCIKLKRYKDVLISDASCYNADWINNDEIKFTTANLVKEPKSQKIVRNDKLVKRNIQ